MLNEMLSIVVDPVFKPLDTTYREKESEFELLYCEAGSKFNMGLALNSRQSYHSNLYPIAELQPQIQKFRPHALLPQPENKLASISEEASDASQFAQVRRPRSCTHTPALAPPSQTPSPRLLFIPE